MLQIRQINGDIRIGLLDLQAFGRQTGISAKRELEKAGAQHLLQTLLIDTPGQLHYAATGKPYLANRPEKISVSHSHGKLAIILNRAHETGIDIELVRDKVLQIQHKFLNASERLLASENPGTLIKYWAVKEALYKCQGLKGVDFKENLFIEKDEGRQVIARFDTTAVKKRYCVVCDDIDNYKLAYILHEI